MSASVVVLGYGAEPELEACLASVAAQLGPDDELVLVDNGVAGMAERREALAAHARIVGTGTNTGFAGGCNVGVAHSRGDVLVFLNSDAVLELGALAALQAPLADPGVGIASGCLLLADRPEHVNSVGNPVSYLGITWAGSNGEPLAEHLDPGPVTGATGGFFALTRATWDALGGFDDVYFAYHEDTDLSLRTWLSGRRVEYVPTARARHHYEFSRNARKMYLLERNRWLVVLSDYPPRVLARALPMLLATEPLFLALSVAQGWWRQKLASYVWLATHRCDVARLRSRARGLQVIDDAAFARLLSPTIDADGGPTPPGMGAVNAVLAAWWRLVAPR